LVIRHAVQAGCVIITINEQFFQIQIKVIAATSTDPTSQAVPSTCGADVLVCLFWMKEEEDLQGTKMRERRKGERTLKMMSV
jgi:hypothetical protein